MDETPTAQAAKESTGQMESNPRSLQPPTTPKVIPSVTWEELERFVVEEEDLATANSAYDDFARFSPNTQCLLATALTRLGYNVERCGFTAIAVSGFWREARDTERLVRSFCCRDKELSQCLPFVVEMKPGGFARCDENL